MGKKNDAEMNQYQLGFAERNSKRYNISPQIGMDLCGFPCVKINQIIDKPQNQQMLISKVSPPYAMPQWRTDLADTPAAAPVRPVHWWPIPTSAGRGMSIICPFW